MPRTLYLTTELPYFPGQGGMMALHIRHLAETQLTGVVGPRYPHQPEDALQKMRDTVQRSYWWPEHPLPGDYLVAPVLWDHRTKDLTHLPKAIKLRLWRWLSGLKRYSDDAVVWRTVLVNLAPKLLEAIREERWNAVLLSQSTSVSWLPFLPASLAPCLFFHDIRSDYLRRNPDRPSASNLNRIFFEEKQATTKASSIVVISELDRERAEKSFGPCNAAVAPICIDLEYFSFELPKRDRAPIVLFTGHLSHPPNVDAVGYFLASIWPLVLAKFPSAKFQIVGLQPHPKIVEAAALSTQVELIPNVPDIRPYYRAAAAYVVPMRFGGGVRQKILEAWALGVPVISTTMGAEGIAATDGENCWLRDTPAKFAEQIVALLHTPATEKLLLAARASVQARHSSSSSSPVINRQINFAISRKRNDAPKILYDLRWLNPGHAGGVEQMTYELLSELSGFDRKFAYRFHGSRESCKPLRFPASFQHKIFHTDGRLARWLGWRDAAVRELGRDLSMPTVMTPELNALEWYTRLDFTVVHGLPCHVHQDLRRFPSVVTMHDLQHLHLPDYFSAADIAMREKEYRASCQAASHIICTSEFTRKDVHEKYGIPFEKMTTIWNLPPRSGSSPIQKSAAARAVRDLGIKSPFLYYPAQPWLHKNHRRLLEAIRLVDQSLPSDYKLVLTGQPFPDTHPAAELMNDPVVRKRVIHLGYRSPGEVSALYRTATAMVFPSLFEGFGIPLVEAMQQECPVICGSHTCLPEIAGEAALVANVSSAEEIARAISKIVKDDALRGTLRQKGAENLRRFNRRQLAEKTRGIYAAVHQAHFS